MMSHASLRATHSANYIEAVRLKDVCQMVGVSRPTVWRWVNSDPSFPKPFKLSPSITAWDKAEVEDWLSAKKGGREVCS